MNNVTIVEVINNHNQVFNFNQMEQVLNQTNEQLPQTSSESIINSPRPGRPTNSSTSENAASSPSRLQTRSTSIVEESVNDARSSTSHSESNDRTTNDLPQRSMTEVPNEGLRVKVRMTESEDGWLRRRPKRQEVVLHTTEQEPSSNYEHLVLPTVMQPRPPQPFISNFIPTDIAILPTRPQVKVKLL